MALRSRRGRTLRFISDRDSLEDFLSFLEANHCNSLSLYLDRGNRSDWFHQANLDSLKESLKSVTEVGFSLDLHLLQHGNAPTPRQVGEFIGAIEGLSSLCLKRQGQENIAIQPPVIFRAASGILNAVAVRGQDYRELCLINIEFNGETKDFQDFANALQAQSQLNELSICQCWVPKDKDTPANTVPIATAIADLPQLRMLQLEPEICNLLYWKNQLPRICQGLHTLAVSAVGNYANPIPQQQEEAHIRFSSILTLIESLHSNTTIRDLRMMIGPCFGGANGEVRLKNMRETVSSMLCENCTVEAFSSSLLFPTPGIDFFLHLNRNGRKTRLQALRGHNATMEQFLGYFAIIDSSQTPAPPAEHVSAVFQLLKTNPALWCPPLPSRMAS